MLSNLNSIQPLYSALMSPSANQGFDHFDQGAANQQKVPQTSETTKLYQQSAYQRQDSFEFSLTTRDGDEVTISISRSAYSDQQQLQTNDLSIQAFELGADSAFDLSVDGDLDEQELEAINGLMGQLQSLSDEFFAGNVGQAVNQAMQLDYNSSEIQGFSLDLSQREVAQIATYQEVQALPEQAAVKPESLNAMQQSSLLDHGNQLLKGLSELQQSPAQLPGLIEMALPLQAEVQQWFSDWLSEKLIA